MAIALVYPEAKRGMHSQLNNSTGDFDKANLSRARFVLRHCRDKAEEVLRNAKYPLTVAYEEAQAIVEQQRIAEEERQRQLAALAVLREEFSDLAALVDDQRLGLPEAIAAGDQRREAARLAAEQERLEQERLADFASKVELVRQKAPDLADKMAKGKIDFAGAKMELAERETAPRAMLESCDSPRP